MAFQKQYHGRVPNSIVPQTTTQWQIYVDAPPRSIRYRDFAVCFR